MIVYWEPGITLESGGKLNREGWYVAEEPRARTYGKTAQSAVEKLLAMIDARIKWEEGNL